jgi:glycosyltransferase involved in cell wall biosynthesis
MLLSVIVPARNEAENVGACLGSLVAQSEPGFELGREWELVCVDDGSTDATREIASGFAGVKVMVTPPLPEGWTGKNAALWQAAETARGARILFTDADTVHEPGSLRRALHEREHAQLAMLSYSPRQIVRGFWQRALMPLIFSELASAYPPAMVNDPARGVAAANGQFLLVEREDYFKVGGHRAVMGAVLEDVALARRFKRAGMKIRLRYAPEQVAARMYRSTGEMMQGWTKNLALLFPHPIWLAAMRKLDLALMVGLPLLCWLLPRVALTLWWQQAAIMLVWLHVVWRFYGRVRKSEFPVGDCALAPVAVPLFAWLLWRSWAHMRLRGKVSWKGREYKTKAD